MNELDRIIKLADGMYFEIARDNGVWWLTINGYMHKGITLDEAVKKAEKRQGKPEG